MIAIEKSHEERQAPATSLDELADRLYPLVGRVLKIQRRMEPSVNWPDTLSAVLECVWLIEEGSGPKLNIYIAFGENHERITLKLDASISLLADGLWSPIHAPKEG